MAIKPIMLQRRLAEVGKIKLGQRVEGVSKQGKAYTRPEKLEVFRFTSVSKELIEKVAQAYGGTVEKWIDNGTERGWEVVTTSNSVPVIVPPQDPDASQYMESWSGGRCVRRCDGETELLSGSDCPCIASDDMVCKPKTRLSVMLRDIEGIGTWRVESNGWNAASKLPSTIAFLNNYGGYTSAWLYLVPGKKVVEVNGKVQTITWMEPALRVEGVTSGQLAAGAGPAAVGSSDRPALEGGARRDLVALIASAQTRDEVLELWREAKETGAGNPEQIEAAAKARVQQLLEQVADEAGEPDEDPPPAVPAREPDAIWSDIVNAAGDEWTLTALEEAFARRNEGVHFSSGTAEQLEGFLVDLTHGWVKP